MTILEDPKGAVTSIEVYIGHSMIHLRCKSRFELKGWGKDLATWQAEKKTCSAKGVEKRHALLISQKVFFFFFLFLFVFCLLLLILQSPSSVV